MKEQGTVDPVQSQVILQLSESTKRKAVKMAEREGVSLEDFILLAITEHIVRSE